MQKEWFASWFDSPYYHLLYQNHDEQEAQMALDSLLRSLNLPPAARILDLACGKGRHSRYLADQGFEVTGLDISSHSIDFARQFESDRLSFFQHDMRQPFRINYFDAVVNFFTSFGYFENDEDHLLTLRQVGLDLRPGGLFLLDFLNSDFVRRHLVRADIKTAGGIEFRLSRWIEGHYVHKTVEFQADGRDFHFSERVRLFTLADFQAMFAQAGLWLKQLYGDYDLRPFDLTTSKRLILLAEKSSVAA